MRNWKPPGLLPGWRPHYWLLLLLSPKESPLYGTLTNGVPIPTLPAGPLLRLSPAGRPPDVLPNVQAANMALPLDGPTLHG